MVYFSKNDKIQKKRKQKFPPETGSSNKEFRLNIINTLGIKFF